MASGSKENAADKLEPDPRDYLERMHKAAARMQTLINDLLDVFTRDHKAQPFHAGKSGDVAREVVDDLEARIEQVTRAAWSWASCR